MIKVKTIPTPTLRTRGGFDMFRKVMVVWPGLTLQYYHGPKRMLWTELIPWGY